MSSSNPVPRLYRTVVDDVIKNVREAFLNEGVDDQVLQELKQLWESKLLQSRAIDFIPADPSVRLAVSYPHTHALQIQQTSQQPQVQQQSTIQQHHTIQPQQIQPQQIQPQQASLQSVTPAIQEVSQIVQNPQTGQVMYVNHPTLGDVGQMSLPATQAALAIQGAARHEPSATATVAAGSHSLPGIVSNAAQLPQVQQVTQNTQQGTATAVYPGYQPAGNTAGRGPRVIYTPPTQNPRAHAPVKIIQVDGMDDSSSEEDIDDEEDDYSKFDEYPITGNVKGDDEEEELEEDDPLNSGDDVSEDDPTDLFDTDNVVVCQYDKIARSKNKWKFHLKDGIMNLTRKDFVFHKAVGESEW